MGKIYVITAGAYSDYHICGATTDRNRANDMLRKMKAFDRHWFNDLGIEEFDDGAFVDIYTKYDSIEPANYWEVELRTGTKEPKIRQYTGSKGQVMRATCREVKGPWEEYNGYPRREKFTIYTVDGITAPDKEHAFKIACDVVAEHRAELEGIM